MPDIAQRDPAEVASVLTRWLATKVAEETKPEVFDVQAPASNGFSNETILCRTRTSANGGSTEKRLVVRVAPTKHLLFMDAEFDTQYRVMRTLADGATGIPLPPLGWYEEDPQYLGVPFFIMDHVEGQVPSDNLPYTLDGWVIEATPEQQRTMWWSGIDALAAVHRTDWRALGLDWLGDPRRGRPGIEQQMSYYREFLDWAAKGSPQPTLEATWKWLVDHQPAEEGDVVISWGDSRIGNIIWRRLQVCRRLGLGDGLTGTARDGPRMVVVLQSAVRRRSRRPPPTWFRLARGDHRPLQRAHGASDEGPLLL